MMTNIGVAAQAPTTAEVVARLERLPPSRWHVRIRSIIGVAWFFDAFDALAIAYVLPVLIGLWKLSPLEIGSLIAVGYVGQAIGSLFFGWLAERWGRVPCALITLAIFTVFSLVCAFAWSLQSLMWLRFLQGIGLGGEIPILHAYVNEFANSKRRGRFTLITQLPFPIGLFAAALIGSWAVPHLGWQSMFIIGAIPAVLALPLRLLLPESPRWLANNGKAAEAGRVLDRIESTIAAEGKVLPAVAPIAGVAPVKARFTDAFKGIYLKRSLVIWAMWFCCYLVAYGLAGWLPSIYRSVYKLSVQEALQYGLISSIAGLIGGLIAVALIDTIGRRLLIGGCLLLGGLPMLVLFWAPSLSALEVLALVCVSFGLINAVALSLGVYTAENYPTSLRAVGSGLGSTWVRIASIVGPYVVGFVLPMAGIGPVFVLFGIVAIIGGLICLMFAIETRGRLLEELSPPIVR
jgi:MFS transporter, putative metabolite:H+ symporter